MHRSDKQAYPETPQKTVTDMYHGIAVKDDYRWLENSEDSAVQEWTAKQNQFTRKILDAIPEREAISQRLQNLYTSHSADYHTLTKRGNTFFAIKVQPAKEQPILVSFSSIDDLSTERIILDPMKLDPQGTTTIDFYVPSPDGSLVAVSLSQNDTEEGTLYLYETVSGRKLSDEIPRITYPTCGGDVAWHGAGTGFFYTRYPCGDERPPEDHTFYQQVYFHQLGTSIEDDRYEIGQTFPRIAEVFLRPSGDYDYLLALVANGTSGEYAHYLRDRKGHWHQITCFEDEITHATFGTDKTLYLLSRQNAPRGKIVRLPLSTPRLSQVKTIVEQGEHTIETFTSTTTRLYVTELTGGPSQIHIYDHSGKDRGVLPQEPVSSIGQVLHLDQDAILFRSTSFITPPAWYRFSPPTKMPIQTAYVVTSPANFNNVEVTRVFATSKDGTQIPLNIIHHKDIVLDGTHPTLLYGYGGLGISLTPSFQVRRQLWLDYGGVFVVANLRGGGEYGKAWHHDGIQTKRQNVFDDFIASAEYLIAQGYTQPAKLAIEGRSNGGLLMGVALTQRPDLFRAVVAHVGIYDMLRVELHPNGASNVPEFGTVQNREAFDALYAYSPFHRVVDGTAYPAAMFVTGENDGRVDPANSRRMTARLQAATRSHLPILLRTSMASGHGIGTTRHEQIAEETDVFTFLINQLKGER